MGRSKRTPLISKQLDTQELEKILQSTAPREVKLRKISQLNNGNKKVGTLQAKSILENYQKNPLQNMINNLDPQTKGMFHDIQEKMGKEEFTEFLHTLQSKIKDPNELNNLLESVKEQIKEEDIAGPSQPEIKPEIKEQLDEQNLGDLVMDANGNEVDEELDITEADLPILEKKEFDFISSLMKK